MIFGNHGSVWTVEPETREEREWLKTELVSESWQWLGKNLVVEARFVDNVIGGAQAFGFEVR